MRLRRLSASPCGPCSVGRSCMGRSGFGPNPRWPRWLRRPAWSHELKQAIIDIRSASMQCTWGSGKIVIAPRGVSLQNSKATVGWILIYLKKTRVYSLRPANRPALSNPRSVPTQPADGRAIAPPIRRDGVGRHPVSARSFRLRDLSAGGLRPDQGLGLCAGIRRSGLWGREDRFCRPSAPSARKRASTYGQLSWRRQRLRPQPLAFVRLACGAPA